MHALQIHTLLFCFLFGEFILFFISICVHHLCQKCLIALMLWCNKLWNKYSIKRRAWLFWLPLFSNCLPHHGWQDIAQGLKKNGDICEYFELTNIGSLS